MVTRRSRWTGDISKNAVTAFPGNSETSFLGSPPLIGGQWRGLHSQGNCHLPSRVNSLYLCNILFNLVFLSPEKCRAMWSWGLQGSRIQVHKSKVVNEQNSDFSSIVLDPLPYLVVSNATRRYFIFCVSTTTYNIHGSLLTESLRKDLAKPYDPHKAVWTPDGNGGFTEGIMQVRILPNLT